MKQLAQQAAAAWGGVEVGPDLISHRENAVFSVQFENYTKAALRLHRPGYNSVQEIKSELWWTNALAENGFPAPRPIAAIDGSFLVELADNMFATVISWVDGAPIGAAGEPLSGSPLDQIQLYSNLGAVLARLHMESDALKLPADFQRRKWDVEGLLGTDPLWGRFWESSALSADTKRVIDVARMQAHHDLAEYSKDADFGLIHADALRENVFQSDTGLTLIDFDDAGFGFRMFDLAVAVSQSRDDANLPDLRDAIVTGYSKIRPLSDADLKHFDLFTMLRCFASLGWSTSRLPEGHSDLKRYARRAEMAANDYIERIKPR